MTVDREYVVVFGGPSAEHEISCISALRVASAAVRAGAHVELVGVTHAKQWVDMSFALGDMEDWDSFPSPDTVHHDNPDARLGNLREKLSARAVVFPLLHGPFGEDGVIQGHLEVLGVPYVGAGVLSSAICMDKGVAKAVLRDHGIPVPAWRLLARAGLTDRQLDEALAALGFPLFVKPANLGSSIGVTKVKGASDVAAALAGAFEFDDFAIVEEGIEGREFEVALLGNDTVRATA
ncbi:MAG TPA: D-alanine--D-alanine ligase A, partial [Acidimicrobiales bacterium]|nr:D-alanine--D-alanine ligase A [Acidimicrobiales bacterium]